MPVPNWIQMINVQDLSKDARVNYGLDTPVEGSVAEDMTWLKLNKNDKQMLEVELTFRLKYIGTL